MNALTNSVAHAIFETFGKQAPQGVLKAIETASAKTGVNFSYMLQQAAVESRFDPEAKAKSSSASGLYQFIESTWLSMVDKYGEKHGIETEGKSKKEILALRNDPEISANMAAEFASENEKFLQDHWAKGKKDIGSTELYLAHFMGAGGAAGFLNARDKNPLQQAALLFPEAAQANKSVFYDTKTGRPKTMDEVYGFFDKKFQIKDNVILPEMETASAQLLPPAVLDTAHAKKSAQATHALYGQIAQNNFLTSSIYTNTPPLPAPALPPVPHGMPKNKIPDTAQSLLRSPIDLMLLAQLDTLNPSKDSNQKSKF